jgi:hypothetical protein
VLSLLDAQAEFENTAFFSAAGDFASILEGKNVSFIIRDCRFRSRARDAVLISMENEVRPSPGAPFLFLDSVFTVESSFVARALEVRGFFPSVSGCAFIYGGNGRNSEVFSLVPAPHSQARLPGPGFIGGNSFTSFRYIMGRDYPMDNIEAFNRIFAPRGRNNVIVEPGRAD